MLRNASAGKYGTCQSSFFSAAASLSWTVKAFKIGTLVGEEAGGMNVSYGDVVGYVLPHSKLQLGISFKRFLAFRSR